MSDLRKRANRGEMTANLMTVQDAISDTVHNTHGVEPKALAEAANMRYRDVLDIANPFEQRKLRAEEIAPLINGTFLVAGKRAFQILDVIERQVGRIAIPLPQVSPSAQSEHLHAIEAIKQFGEQQARYAQILEDGQVTAEECAAYASEADEAIAAIVAMKALVESKVPQR